MLRMKTGKGTARFTYTDGRMEASWTLRSVDDEGELISGLEAMLSFLTAQTGRQALPAREAGTALQVAQEAYPEPPRPANGWADVVQPEIPEHAKGDWELIPKEERE